MVSSQASLCITIDGPAGAGKSTVAKKLAATLGYLYVDTGAMYRAVTLRVLESGIGLDDLQSIKSLVSSLDLSLKNMPHQENQAVFLDGRDVTKLVRSPEVNRCVSQVSAIECVRSALVDAQRQMARQRNVVMEGRDVGSVVLPDADVKIFLVASQTERANRRVRALSQAGYCCTFEQALNEIRRRDAFDTSRSISPLTKPEGAIEIDSTDISADEVVALLVQIVNRVLSDGVSTFS